jgi:hypothetical protein
MSGKDKLLAGRMSRCWSINICKLLLFMHFLFM